MRFLSILIGMVLSFNSLAQDSSCRPVNLLLEKKKWGKAAFLTEKFKKAGKYTRWDHAIKQMPIYDQGATGICYAFK